MSAYIVKDDTINRILAYIEMDEFNRNGPHYGYLFREARALIHDVPKSPWHADDAPWLPILGQRMAELNHNAVNYRYHQDAAPVEYTFAHVPTPTDIQALKSIRCWLYQCAEGEYSNCELFKAFEKMAHRIALGIVNKLPAYREAAWA